MTTEFHKELLEIAARLDDVAKRAGAPEIADPLRRLEESATHVGKAWSGSALGYHARIYYRDFKPPPPGHHFSPEWGMQDSWPIGATTGDWVEHDPDDIEQTIRGLAGNPDLSVARDLTVHAEALFGGTKSEVLSLLTTAPEKVTIAWAVRHVPLSWWWYLAGIIGSAFIFGATVSQLPSVRAFIPTFRQDMPPQSVITPSI